MADMGNIKTVVDNHKTTLASTAAQKKRDYIQATDLSQAQKYILRRYADTGAAEINN
jgi:hypothetical protein